eukprot:GHUV01058684.1.p1 GENE.GHUV01058684.1~~GHUV01058684.1.p1  ORF type:complete len:188 (-),score=33.53 GHUV01058684.1:108-671(-)
MMSVSDNTTEGPEGEGSSSKSGGGTLQVWRISDLLYRPEDEVVAELEAHRLVKEDSNSTSVRHVVIECDEFRRTLCICDATAAGRRSPWYTLCCVCGHHHLTAREVSGWRSVVSSPVDPNRIYGMLPTVAAITAGCVYRSDRSFLPSVAGNGFLQGEKRPKLPESPDSQSKTKKQQQQHLAQQHLLP